MRIRKWPWLSIGTLALVACGHWQSSEPITPVSYKTSMQQIPRTVGQLRRIALLALIQPSPLPCLGGTATPQPSFDAKGSEVTEAARVLVDSKGYEILLIDRARLSHPWVDAREQQALLDELASWSANSTASDALTPQVQSFIESVVKRDGVDALMLLHIQTTCTIADPGTRALLGALSLGLELLFPSQESLTARTVYRAVLIESATLRPVFRKTLGPTELEFKRKFGSRSNRSDVDMLLDGLETAVPKILTRPH